MRCARTHPDETAMPDIQRVCRANMPVDVADKVLKLMQREGMGLPSALSSGRCVAWPRVVYAAAR